MMMTHFLFCRTKIFLLFLRRGKKTPLKDLRDVRCDKNIAKNINSKRKRKSHIKNPYYNRHKNNKVFERENNPMKPFFSQTIS